MSGHYPCGGLNRRHLLLGAAAVVPMLSALHVSAQEKTLERGKLGIPGPYPGRVVEVRNPAMIKDGVKNREAIQASVARGMKELTGADDATEGWRTFFEPGDVVGIKVVPNGFPAAPTSAELILEVIEGLKAAGVKTNDMFVYDRYRSEFMDAGLHKILPDGIKWGGLTPENESTQLVVDFPSFRKDPIAGYDPDEFVHMNLVHNGHDPKDERTRRSHLGLLVTKRINKLVLLPVLKDHGSAGVTGALKNMSHGSVNNVARSHSTPGSNACNQFIPEVVSHPILRQKCVLHIMDGIRGIFQGGPFGKKPEWSWEHNGMLFATDPVALDHVEWTLIDAQRAAKNLPPVAASGRSGLNPLGTEGFDIRQPQHIALAGNLGLGVFDFKSPKGRRHTIDHRVVQIG